MSRTIQFVPSLRTSHFADPPDATVAPSVGDSASVTSHLARLLADADGSVLTVDWPMVIAPEAVRLRRLRSSLPVVASVMTRDDGDSRRRAI